MGGSDWNDVAATAPNERSWGVAAPTESNENAWGVAEPTGISDNADAEPAKEEVSKDEYLKRAKDKGWTQQMPYDYESYLDQKGSYTGWHGAAKVYEWDDEFGDVAPPVPQLEEELFGGEFIMRVGTHFENIANITVDVEGKDKLAPIEKFEDAGLHPVVMENITKCAYKVPTPVQSYAIPAILTGYDTVVVAQTGSGKTAAYLIPILSKLMGKAKKLSAPRPNVNARGYNPQVHKVKGEPLVLVVVPTRELAIQIYDEARRMCYRSMLRPVVTYGGLPMRLTVEELGKGCDILIATPGRLCDLMDKPHLLSVKRVRYTVIDEADEMLAEDWEEELNKIMAGGDANDDAGHVYMMFSATFPAGARKLARQYMVTDHYRIVVGRIGSAHKNITQDVIEVAQNLKYEAAYDLIMASPATRTIVFCNSILTVDRVDDFLYSRGLPSTSIHRDRNQREREDALRAFRRGSTPILVSTGLAARGWDVKDVGHVINLDLPSVMHGGITEYTNRIGRTGRIGHTGLATSFYNDRNDDIAQDLVNVLVENDQKVPDFLAHLVPEDKANIDFGDESDNDDETDNGDIDSTAAEAPWGGAEDGGNGAKGSTNGFVPDGGAFAHWTVESGW